MSVAEATAVLAAGDASAPRRGSSAAQKLHLLEHDPQADRAALKRLAALCEAFSPIVGIEEVEAPECLLLDATGLGPLFAPRGTSPQQAERAWVEQVVRQFNRWGFTARFALADTVGAAWALAHESSDSESEGEGPVSSSPRLRTLSSGLSIIAPRGAGHRALAGLPLAALRLDESLLEGLRELGIVHIDDLAQLPRDQVAARFGDQLARRWDQALGHAPETITPTREPPVWQDAWTLECAAQQHAALEPGIEQRLEKWTLQLARQGRGIQRLECRLRGEQGELTQLDVALYRPRGEARYVLELLRLRMESCRLREPVIGVQLVVTATAALEYRQQEMFDGQGRAGQGVLASLLDRLSSRLGPRAVLAAVARNEAQPELGCSYRPWLDLPAGKRASRATGPASVRQRPMQLAREPQPLKMVSVVPNGPPLLFTWQGRQHRIVRRWGPERIETGWWRGPFVRRDYYRVETDSGHWFWLFRHRGDGQWFLHGWFD